ncbi:hypothetical protein SAMN05216178_6800 [Pseudomonas saponiphila]|uniref:Uncharacterized protein n=1 Tax=Pseudomonas saponiphila TaxID=556534 RepID=A0A1H4ZRM3_9PSED|nr:hypothetical protein [Pseudomonas saponiphila]SED32779.1 hypothetical protein SAMN05216178_6800 [Pseudomonas saponiphila]
MNKKHRAAFAADPSFLARIAHTKSGTNAASVAADQKLPKREPSKAVLRAKKVQEANKDGRYDAVVSDESLGTLTFIFSGAMLLSLNVSLRMHDAKASALKDTWKKRVQAVVLENRALIYAWQQRCRFPLIVEEVYITAESALLDTEAVAAACKPIIDALVFNQVVPDDNCKFICQPLAYTERGPSPALLISFKPSPKPWGFIDDASVELARAAAKQRSVD